MPGMLGPTTPPPKKTTKLYTPEATSDAPPCAPPMDPVAGDLQFECDWRLAFNVEAGKKAPLGYLRSWSGCGGLDLPRDIELFHPIGAGTKALPGPKITCVGVIESLVFRSECDPISVSAFISREGAANVRAKLAQPVPTTKVQCDWVIIDHDDDRKSWYDAAYARDGAKVEANIDVHDGELVISVDRAPEPISPTLDIGVFRFRFQIVPPPGRTTKLEFATGPSIKLVRAWGTSR